MSTLKTRKSLSRFIKQEDDEFWDDCLNIDTPNENTLEKMERIQISDKTNKMPKKSDDNNDQFLTFKKEDTLANNTNNTQTHNTNNTNINNSSNNTNNTNTNTNTNPTPLQHVPNTSSINQLVTKVASPDRNQDAQQKEQWKERKMNDLVNKYNIDKFYTPEELEEKHQEELKQQKAIERCYMLYEKGKIKNEVNRIMYHKNEELKAQEDLKSCTWVPKTNKLNKKLEENLKIITKDTKIYNRAMKWKFKKNQKVGRSKSELAREALDYTYKPAVNVNPDLENVFQNNKNIFTDSANRNFVNRYEKARFEEKEKINRIVPDLGKKLKGYWDRPMLRSSSLKNREAEVCQMNLHEDLHSFKYDEK
jgi:hypothetical protein